MILAFKDLHLSYGKRAVLQDLQGEFEAGKIHGLIGPNGAGKSSLLNAMAGLNEATGKVYYDLNPIANMSFNELAQQRAYCEQKARLEINFTVEELIEFGIEAGAYAKPEQYPDILQYIAKYCGITQFLGKRIFNLSGGEQQLVHFARAVAQVHPDLNTNASLLFLDEPNSALDIKNTLFLYDRMKDLKNKGLTLVCVIHNLNDCTTLCDKILLMEKGRIVLHNDSDKVLNNRILDHVFGVDFKREYGEDGQLHLQPQLKNEKQYEYVR